MAENPWFRLYSEFATDPKVQMLSEANQRRYIMLLCLRCSNGDVTLHDEEVAFQLRISNEDWEATKAVLVAKGLIGEDNSPSAWDRRQYRSDSSAERVRRHRENKKQQCNVTVTAPDTDTDTDTDTEVDLKTPAAPSGAAPAKPRTQSAARFAEFWQAWPAGPRKQAKAECEKKWKARGLDDLADEIIGHVRAILKTKQFQDFTPAPLTYLNQRRWEDGAPSGGDEQSESSPFRGAL